MNWIDPEGLWTQNHHEYPKYLGGNPKGPTVPLEREYHQKITNEFRHRFRYGEDYPVNDPAFQKRVQKAMKEIYEEYRLPKRARAGLKALSLLAYLEALLDAIEASQEAEKTGKSVWQVLYEMQLKRMGISIYPCSPGQLWM